MAAEFINIILYLIFEIFVLFSSIRIIYLITNKTEKKISEIPLIISWISVSIILTVFIPTLFSFLKFNGVSQYLLFSLIVLLVLHLNRKSELIIYKNYIVSIFNSILTNIYDWKVLVIIALLLPVILVSITPIDGFDDRHMLNFVFDWMFNEENPYERYISFVAFWDISFLPSMVISKSDSFFWINSFKALILLGLGTYTVGSYFKTPKYLIWVSVLSTFLFFKFWIHGNTIGSLKNDYIFAAGIILVICALSRTILLKKDRFCDIFFMLGAVFLLTKYQGVVLVIVAIVIYIFLNRKIISKNKINSIKWASVFALVILSTTGHYYLVNYFDYGNPFYPSHMSLLGFELPGPKEWSGSSIIANIDDEDLTSKFFSTEEVSVGGILFPVILIFGYLGTAAVFFFYLSRYYKKKQTGKVLILVSSFLFLTWILYLVTPFSAGKPEGGLFYLRDLQSIRYLIGPIFLTELLFYTILWKLKIPLKFIFPLIIVNSVSRYWILIDTLPSRFEYSLVIIPAIALLGLYLTGRFVKRFSLKMTALTIVIIAIFFLSPQLVDENRGSWLAMWKDVIDVVHTAPAADIYLIEDKGRGWEILTPQYTIQGEHFQHNVTIGTFGKLSNIINQRGFVDDPPEYVVQMCRFAHEGCEQDFINLELKLEQEGYKIVTKDKRAIIFRPAE